MIVTTVKQFNELLEGESIVALDIETKGKHWFSSDTSLLGIGLYFPNKEAKCYVPLRVWDGVDLIESPTTEPQLRYRLMEVLPKLKLIIHNSSFDYAWLKYKYSCPIEIFWDTRIAWHLISPELAEELQNGKFKRSHYSLDDGIRMVLQQDSHKEDFDKHIQSKGGKVKNGEHYKADTSVLAEYCENDCYFTYLLYLSQVHILAELKAVGFMQELFKYQEVLIEQYKNGICFDVDKASKYAERVKKSALFYKRAIEKECKLEIDSIRRDMTWAKANGYKTDKKKQEVLAGDRVPFNFNSPKQFTTLLEKLGVDIKETTEKGAKKTDKATLKKYEDQHQAIGHINRLSELTTASEFIEQYQKVITNGKYHAELDICGTASGRLAGFSPNILAVNRRDKRFMSCFKSREGYEFIDFDWRQIEPRVLAHFSNDEELAEMIVQNKDIYLEHLVKIYPEKMELYDPKDLAGSKQRLKKERDIIKKAILALNYGTGINKLAFITGLPTEEARKIYNGYWGARHKVKSFENKLQLMYSKDGLVRNIINRPLLVSKTKDLLNRFIQSSAHDIHIYTTILINENIKSSGLDTNPVMVDVHDEGIYEVRYCDVLNFLKLLHKTISDVNSTFSLSLPLEIEYKIINNFGGLDK